MRVANERRRFTCGQIGGLILIFAVVAAFLFPLYPDNGRRSMRLDCLQNLKQEAVSIHMYLNDSHDVLPPAEVWHDATAPYRLRELRCPKLETGYGYALNDSKKRLPRNAEKWPMLFESLKLEPNAHDHLTSLLEEPRHTAVNVAFGDAHARGYRLSEGMTIKEQLLRTIR